MKYKIDDRVVFMSSDDLVWGEYAGKDAIVVGECTDEDDGDDLQSLDILFEDGRKLGVQAYECEPYKESNVQ